MDVGFRLIDLGLMDMDIIIIITIIIIVIN